MGLLHINVELTALVEVAREIRDILRQAVPPPVIPDQNPRKRGKEDLVRVSPETLFEKERERKIQRAKEEGIPLDDDSL